MVVSVVARAVLPGVNNPCTSAPLQFTAVVWQRLLRNNLLGAHLVAHVPPLQAVVLPHPAQPFLHLLPLTHVRRQRLRHVQE